MISYLLNFINIKILYKQKSHKNKPHSVSYKFGVVAMVSGIVGVPLGSAIAQYFRPRHPDVDPIVCATGLMISAPFVYFSLIVAKYSSGWCFFLVLIAEISLNLCWSLVADMVLVR